MEESQTGAEDAPTNSVPIPIKKTENWVSTNFKGLSPNLNGRVFPCPQCDKTFKETRTLKLHLKIHNAEYPEQCPTCFKVFRTKWQLKQHQMDHGGERPYPCPECPFTCKTKQQLNEHRRKHSGEKAYSCPQCSTRFTYRNGLIKHTKLNRCPKKVVTPEGETIIKKRTRTINNQSKKKSDAKMALKEEVSKRKTQNNPPSPHEELSTSNGNNEAQTFHQVEYINNALSQLSAATGLTTEEIKSWASSLPPGSTVQVTHHFQPPQNEDLSKTFYIKTTSQDGGLDVYSTNEGSSGCGHSSNNFILKSQLSRPEYGPASQNTGTSVPLPSYVEAFAVDPNKVLHRNTLKSRDYPYHMEEDKDTKSESMEFDQPHASMYSWQHPHNNGSSSNCPSESSSLSPEGNLSDESNQALSSAGTLKRNEMANLEMRQEVGALDQDLLNNFNEQDFHSIKTIVEQTFRDGRDMLDIISAV